jgi:hypothetical protein
MSAEADSPVFSVDSLTHRALGPLLRLTAPGLALRLTPREARTLALALRAVAEGRSAERDIFMSPIASDGYFVGRADDGGLAVEAGAGALALPWPAVTRLADALVRATGD